LKIVQENIVSKLKNGQNDAFVLIYNIYFKKLSKFSFNFVGDIDVAQDIVQKTIINIWEKREMLLSTDNKDFEKYLFKSVYYNTLSNLKQTNLHKQHKQKILLELSGSDTSYSDHMLDEETKEKIKTAINKLPYKCKEVLELSRFQGMKYKEIAEKLDVSTKNVEYHISNALKLLKENLKKYMLILIPFITYIVSELI
jgi:RNA polymerase sigma-70 factor (ECF subfamily)